MKLTKVAAASALLAASFGASAGHPQTYEITITNVTKGVIFTPILAVTHKKEIALFEVGQPASEPLADLAEGGATDPLVEALSGLSAVTETQTGEAIMPGMSITMEISASRRDVLSIGSMLLPTNDTFLALDSVRLPRFFRPATYYAKAYDAGSETNDELCANIPGPQCNGTPFSPEDDGEGYVYPSPGIHGEADLSREAYNWGDPVAVVNIVRLRH